MRFLHVIHYPVFGGPHNEVLRLASPLSRLGWTPVVLLPHDAHDPADRLRTAGIEVVQAPLHRVRLAADPRPHLALLMSLKGELAAIRQLIHDREIDLVLVGGLVNPHAGFAARSIGVPVVWQLLDTRPPALVRRVLTRLVLRLSDALMFNGRALVQAHVGSTLLDLPYATYDPPVDTERFVPSHERRHKIRSEFAVPDDACVVGTVANLNPQKGLEYFIRAASIISERRRDTWFMIVGAAHDTHRKYAHRLHRELASSSIPEGRFIFLGGRSDVEEFYPAMDVKVITSVPRSEGTTTTGIEALSCGVPVVATDVGAVREVIEDGVTGFIVPPLDPAAVAHSVLTLLDDTSLHDKMSANARDAALTRFDVSVCVGKYVRLFEAAAKRRSILMHSGEQRL